MSGSVRVNSFKMLGTKDEFHMNWQEQWPEQLRKFGLLNPQRVAECKSRAEPTKIERELLAAMDPEAFPGLIPRGRCAKVFYRVLKERLVKFVVDRHPTDCPHCQDGPANKVSPRSST